MQRKAVLINGLSIKGRKALLDLSLMKISESCEKVRALVIVDNFEDSKFDDDIVSKLDMNVEILGGGCFCCQLKEDFRALLEEEEEVFGPSAIFVELPIMADADLIKSIMKDAIQTNLEFVTVFVIDYESADTVFETFPDMMERNLSASARFSIAPFCSVST